jgi:hypothetical protein
MLKKIARTLAGQTKRDGVKLAVIGMGSLLTGQKVASLTAFARGWQLLEAGWREAHPEFEGDLSARWKEALTFYESTHTDKTNRFLHLVGIPMIVGGAAGLLLAPPFRPVWSAAAGAFVLGWGLNILGHAKYEGNAPAFADDPLSFIAGPIWDLQQVVKKRGKTSSKPTAVPNAA